MRKLIIIGFVLITALAMAATIEQQGIKTVGNGWIWWGSGSGEAIADSLRDSMVTVYVTDDSIWYDTAAAGTWKVLTGSVDSCSYPFWLTDPGGSVYPERLQYISFLLSSTRTDSNDVQFFLETRELYRTCRYAGACTTGASGFGVYGMYIDAFTPWVGKDEEVGGADFTVIDSIRTVVITGTANTARRQKLHFQLTGYQGRLCPEVPTTFLDTDTLTVDSAWYIGR